MDKRFVIFLLLSFAILMGNIVLQAYLNPPPEQVAQQPEDERAVAGKTENAKKTQDAKTGKTEKTQPADSKQANDVEPPPKEVVEPEPAKIAPVLPAVLRRLVSLGSADPQGQYRILATLDNRGASVRRIELSSERYRDLHDESGYLGHLGLDDVAGQCIVGVVGAGTPAAEAGLLAGDVITAIDGQPLDVETDAGWLFGSAALRHLMADTKIDQTIEITVQRGNKPLELSATLRRRPLEVIRPERENYLMRGESVPEGFVKSPSLLLTLLLGGDLDEPDEKLTRQLHEGHWEVGTLSDDGIWQAIKDNKQLGDSVTFRQKLPDEELIVYKTFTLDPVPDEKREEETEEEFEKRKLRAYHLTVSVRIENTGSERKQVGYILDGPNGLPTEGWWYAYKISPDWFGSAGLRDCVFDLDPGDPQFISCATVVDQAKKGELEPKMNTRVKYIGVDAQYFSAVLFPSNENTQEVEFAKVAYDVVGASNEDQPNLSNVSFQLTSSMRTLQPGESVTDEFELFAGPRRPDLMEAYGIDGLIYYGWFWWVAKPMLWLLHFFFSFIGNYGVAIFMLTVLVRSCMFPISRKQALGAQKMAELQPEIKRLHEKYGKDMEKKMKAQRELFKKHNYNPLAGCLPVFFQLPIFIGLYRSLAVDIELRDASLLGQSIRWCSNLAAPDRLLDWSGWLPGFITQGQGIFVLGPYLNILPIITITTWIIQQKMFMPPPTDDQQAMQQKIMKYMMVFMGFMFFKVAAGLCLYFIASSTWSICERKMLPKAKAPEVKPEDKTDPLVERREARKASTTGASTNGTPQTRKKKKSKQGRK